MRDRRAAWQQSLSALQLAKDSGARLTKSSIMLGCGEQPHEVLATFKALRDHGELLLPLLIGRVPARHIDLPAGNQWQLCSGWKGCGSRTMHVGLPP